MTRVSKTTGLAVTVVAVIGFLYFAHHTRVEAFSYSWYPDDSYAPARRFPELDVRGQPRVVLVRTVGSTECYSVYYSKELENLLKQNPTRRIKVTYRVTLKFGRPYWIETLDTEGMPFLTGSTEQHGRGQCF